MNKRIIASLSIATMLIFSGCTGPETKDGNSSNVESSTTPSDSINTQNDTENSADETKVIPQTPEGAIELLKAQNTKYCEAIKNDGDISEKLRKETVDNGQSPYAVVLTCSDSRVVPEHMFMEGINSIFTIRNAGNVVDETVLGSIEYGAEHIENSKVVVILGHTHCGAVDATLDGGGHGNVKTITDKIATAIDGETDARAAEIKNVNNSIDKVLESPIIKELVENGKISVVGAIYNAETGAVDFLEETN